MKKKLKFFYDDEGDILDISIGNPRNAISRELDDDVILRIDNKQNIIGFTILNFKKRFKGKNIAEVVPISAEFNLIET